MDVLKLIRLERALFYDDVRGREAELLARVRDGPLCQDSCRLL